MKRAGRAVKLDAKEAKRRRRERIIIVVTLVLIAW